MSDFMINFESEYNLRVYIENYKPARPAPPCSNPDSPAFSDPGDDAEYDVILIAFVLSKKTLKHNPVTDDFDEVVEECEIELSREDQDFLPITFWEDLHYELEKQYEEELIDQGVIRMEMDIEDPPDRR